MKNRAGQAGFTLIEMLTGLLVTSIILSAVAAAVIFSQRSYQLQAQSKTAVEGGRIATDYLERMVRMAGYGLDPRLAFDFRTANLPSNLKDNFAFVPAAGSTAQPFFTDDLAFRYRDPTFLRRGLINWPTLELDPADPAKATFGRALRAGQPIMLVCPGGSNWFMGVLTADVAPGAVAAQVGFYPNPPALGADTNLTAEPECVQDTAGQQAYVMLVQERRVRIIDQGGRSFLVVFNSLNLPVNSLDFDPLAVDVENFQVAYVMNAAGTTTPPVAADINNNWVFADGIAEASLPDPAAIAPEMEAAYANPDRFTAHPANIRSVRVSIGTRSAGQLGQKQTFERVALENFQPPPLAGNEAFYYRSIIQTTIRTGNLLSRAMFLPPLRESAGDPGELNKDGA